MTWTSGLLLGQAGVMEPDGSIGDAIAALSDLWINGVDTASGAEILTSFAAGAAVAGVPQDFPADPDNKYPEPPPTAIGPGGAP